MKNENLKIGHFYFVLQKATLTPGCLPSCVLWTVVNNQPMSACVTPGQVVMLLRPRGEGDKIKWFIERGYIAVNAKACVEVLYGEQTYVTMVNSLWELTDKQAISLLKETKLRVANENR